MASQSSTKQNGEATTEEVPGSIVTYTGEEINTFKDDMAPQWKHEKEYAACNRPESWYLEKYKTELKLNSISKTFQGTYLISIKTLNFQCYHLDTSFLSVLPRDSCDIGFRVQFNVEFPRQVMSFPIVLRQSGTRSRSRRRI